MDISTIKSNAFLSELLDKNGYFAISSSASLSNIAISQTDNTTDHYKILLNVIQTEFLRIKETQNVRIELAYGLYGNQDKAEQEVVKSIDTYIENHFLKKQTKNFIKLHSYESLEEGWDGYDAPPVPKSVIDRAINIVSHPELKNQPEVFPTARESVQLEYHKPNENYLEIEVFSDYFNIYEDFCGSEKEEELKDINSVVRVINEFHSRF